MFRQGTVKWYNPEKNYGFLVEDGVENEELFFHKTNILTTDKAVDKGQRVSFDVKKTERGLEATDIQPLEE
ncbi:MAG: cold shock domain-containing protein [Parachlamydiales bacterium]|nr:cold shock domain-containing protein [Parachlamydiales bacterium]